MRKLRTQSGASAPSLQHIRHPASLQAAALVHRRKHQTIGFIPTMGALHEGHLALIDHARAACDIVVVSVFVNPLQFNAASDLRAYPRTEASDARACAERGADIFFCPSAADMYPSGFETTLKAGPLGRRFEGRHRPGHFDGMLTVVLKLINLAQPHVAVFGQKDFQQLRLVEQMVRDLHLPVEVVRAPTVREADGLAKSSRNARLTVANRKKAVALHHAITTAQEAIAAGEQKTSTLRRRALAALRAVPGFALEYCDIVDPKTLQRPAIVAADSRMLIAGSFSQRVPVRLIDNAALTL